MNVTARAAGSGPAALSASSVGDAVTKLTGVVRALPEGAVFAADHPDIRVLVEAGQLSANALGSLFSTLAQRRVIELAGVRPSTSPTRRGGWVLTWKVVTR